jgi:hypothetical protein
MKGNKRSNESNKPLVLSSESEFAILPHISRATVEELVDRGLLHFDDVGATNDRWRFGDDTNAGTSRSFSNPKWKYAHSSGKEWHKLIGLSDIIRHDRKHVLFVLEGSKDALAAAEIAFRTGVLPHTGILCALGSGYRPMPSEIEQLQGRRVVVIGDNDAAGIQTTEIVAGALAAAGVDHETWDWSACPDCKDLYQLLQGAGKDISGSKYSKSLLSLSPSYHSTLQPFNPSTTQTAPEAGINSDERLGIVCPFIVTQKGTGNRQSFLLARAISRRKFSMKQIEAIYHTWFERSRAMLPPDANQATALSTFYDQMHRVRFTEAGLESACKRARKAKPPFIPARDGDEEVALAAALCRELQRESGERPFICPVNVVQSFLNLRWPSQANYLLHVLETEKVIQCVERGCPNKKGVKGKPSMWRYTWPQA